MTGVIQLPPTLKLHINVIADNFFILIKIIDIMLADACLKCILFRIY